MTIGVLAMQGAFKEHIKMLNSLGVKAIEVRYESELNEVDGLIIPGGESTVIGKLIKEMNLLQPLTSKIKSGLPVWGTCAGMIVLAKTIEDSDSTHIPVMDIEVRRNAYGKQLGSFKANLSIKGLYQDFPAVFIRAPYIKSVGPNVEVLSTINEQIVAARQGNMLVTSFHPELTNDTRMHELFIQMI